MELFKHILFGLVLLTALSVAAEVTPKEANLSVASPRGNMPTNIMVANGTKVNGSSLSTLDLRDSQTRESMRREIHSNFKRTPVLNTLQKEDEELFTVKCVLKCKDENYPYFAIYNTDFCMVTEYGVWIESEERDTYYFKVPAGTYDVYASFYTDGGMWGHGMLIHEDVVVDSDMEVYFFEDELTEKVIIKPLLRDGQEAVLPLITYFDEEPWYEYDYTDVTIKYENLQWVLFCEGCEPIGGVNSVREVRSKGWSDGDICFLSNKLSDKYHLIIQDLVQDLNGEVQITVTDMIGSESKTINTYTNDFIKYDYPSFINTPLYKEIGVKDYHNIISSVMWFNNINVFEGQTFCYVESLNPEIYYSAQPIDASIDFKSAIIGSNIQGEENIDGWTEFADITALPAIFIDGKWEYVNQNHSGCGNIAFQIPSEGNMVDYPGVPAYCYFEDQITQPFGNSSPILSLYSRVYEYPNLRIFNIEPNAYIGRYGEVRNCDQWVLKAVVKLNDNIVYEGKGGDDLFDWCIDNSNDGHEKGLLEATFINRNVLVDETIPGFNITTIKVDERNEDLYTPTTQMLIFKNTDGVITDRFANSEDGVIEFSAGDFNWVSDGGYYTCEEAEVKVEYAPYGEDSFMPLEVEEIPENYYMPGFGYFYRGSLADVTMPTSNGWYDLRFTLTDKAGNEMVQRISPAFKIDSNTSVAEVSQNGLKVWSADGRIMSSGDVMSIALYAPDGKLITSGATNSLPTNGYRGMGIVKVTATNGITSTHKTVIR